MKMSTEEYIPAIGAKLRTLLIPLIREQYPYIEEEKIGKLFNTMCGSTEKWYFFMDKWIVPNRKVIEREPFDRGDDLIELPQIIPGFTLKPVSSVVYEKVNQCLRLYLNIYDLINQND